MTDNKEKFIEEIKEYLGLDDTTVRLLAYYNSEPAIKDNLDLINELIRKMPDFTYQKYRDLVKARKKADTEVQLDVSKQIADIFEQFLAYNNEASRSECKNYAMAHRIMPCTRERMKRISEELVKNR